MFALANRITPPKERQEEPLRALPPGAARLRHDRGEGEVFRLLAWRKYLWDIWLDYMIWRLLPEARHADLASD